MLGNGTVSINSLIFWDQYPDLLLGDLPTFPLSYGIIHQGTWPFLSHQVGSFVSQSKPLLNWGDFASWGILSNVETFLVVTTSENATGI